jgi:hypothetical protein
MFQYKQYVVKDTDQFDPQQFSLVTDELAVINEHTKHIVSLFKTGIIVSFVKDHSLKNEWIKANPALTEMVTSGALPMRHTEALFESCRYNPLFRKQLEEFLIRGLSV